MLFRTFAQQIAEPQSKITSNIQNMFMEFLVFSKFIATQHRQRHGQYSGNQRLDGTQPEPLLAGKRGPWIKEGYTLLCEQGPPRGAQKPKSSWCPPF